MPASYLHRIYIAPIHHLLQFCSEVFDGGEELGLVVCRYLELDDLAAPSVAVHIDVNVDGTASVAEEQVHLLLQVLDIVLGVALHFRQRRCSFMRIEVDAPGRTQSNETVDFPDHH